uniref:Putative secreted protein n=1 Tax=Anopheles darlingi TaxID=43151 RepID=A0A2M4DK04_ANODA
MIILFVLVFLLAQGGALWFAAEELVVFVSVGPTTSAHSVQCTVNNRDMTAKDTDKYVLDFSACRRVMLCL